MRLILIGGSILLALIVAGVTVAFNKDGDPAKTEKASAVVPETPQHAATVPTVAVVERSEASLIAEAEPIARKFLAASSVDEILTLVRHPEVSEARIRSQYPEGKKIRPVGLSQFNESGVVGIEGKVVSFSLITGDQEEKVINFLSTASGLKVDWESWAGWSEISWNDFLSTKGTAGHVFRVNLSPVEYYNFTFKDDSKWQSYQLTSADGEHSIYGYVEKGSLQQSMLPTLDDVKSVAVMLVLKFPEGATSPNQVVIDRFVDKGWVEDKEHP